MGYTTRPASDMFGAGVSSIGDVRGAFAQNEKKLPRYYEAIDAGRFPIERGYALTPDDLVRRFVITELMCNFHVSRAVVGERFGLDFDRYFAAELADLARLEADGLVEIDDEWITVTPRGRLLVRAVCMVFDKYLRAAEKRASYSRVM